MYQKVLVAVLIAVVLIAGAIVLSVFFLKPSPDTSTQPHTSTEVPPPVSSTTVVATTRIVSGSSEDSNSDSANPTTVSLSVIPTTAVATTRTASGSSEDGSSDRVNPTTNSPTEIPTIADATTRTVSGPPSFTLLVTPLEARARPGDTIRYTLGIEPKGGFDQPVALRLDVSALFLYRNSFDLGTVNPPYPTTLEYSFTVPDDVPGGITVKGVLSGEGGGYRDEQTLVLIVGT